MSKQISIIVAAVFLIALVLVFSLGGRGAEKGTSTSIEPSPSENNNLNSPIPSEKTTLDKPAFFYSDTCPACQSVKPVVEELEKEGYQIEWVNVDENRELTNQYEIMAVPTFVRPDGERIVGGETKEKLADFLKEYKK